MDFGFTDDQREIQRTARDLLADRARPERVREHAEAGQIDEALWKELSELGWPGIALDEEHGGQGLGTIELSILCEELGRSVAPVPFLPSVVAGTLIEHAGSASQRERWLPGLASGEIIGALGVAVGGIAELVIGAPEAQVIVLVDEDNTACVLTPEEAEVTPVASIDSTRSTARVSAPGNVGEPLEGDVSSAVDRALVAVSSELVGVCDRALEMTLAYVKERKQFGVPVGAYQAVSHRCAQMLLDTEKARSTTAFAAWTADSEPERLEVTLDVRSPRARSRPMAVSGSPGRPMSTGCTSARSSTPRCLVARSSTAPAWPRSSRGERAHRLGDARWGLTRRHRR
jgi:alkylation response protein AidB-like acyl-CoA dehydrogenase